MCIYLLTFFNNNNNKNIFVYSLLLFFIDFVSSSFLFFYFSLISRRKYINFQHVWNETILSLGERKEKYASFSFGCFVT